MMKSATENQTSRAVMYADGASRGNPGPSAIGVRLESPTGEVLHEISERIATTTNNVAEYTAVLRGLEWARMNNINELHLRSDSELLIKQLKGQYRVKASHLKPLYEQCQQHIQGFRSFVAEHVRREFNRRADELANLALDQKG